MRIHLHVWVITGESEGHREEIHMCTSPHLILRHEVLVLLKFFLISLQVFHHEILAGKFVVVGEVVDDLVISQTNPYLSKIKPDLGLKRLRTVQTVAQ